ncbi:molybdenum cofactor sulfurase [Sphaerisporangium melleum]|uniref:Molybdenum cofactor sulfurase n=1 Tax=Sphaerisporangium melleum TaxID=321316 RepID=A0A917R511_9ACTN|nr:MOSC N-terminal beta barrel domain-containing protein [Sphaerisporangium melleum]GGK89832.1 molybdenum cofactor sulfurase [Sphaerisporangium melleum]GII72547.1 molybdenum cofactor sulfurase [Sphaerisporangium melleum]
MYQGRIRGLYRWPVKSLRGERVGSALLDARGMAGDRAYALVDERPRRAGTRMTVRQSPRMLAWEAAYPATCDGSPEPPGPPVVYSASGAAWAWDDPDLPSALAESFGAPVSLRAADGQQDRGPTVLVTFEASRRALEEEMGAPVALERFRPNLHLEAGVPAFAERFFEGEVTLTAGEVVLGTAGEHTGPCVRCAVPSWDPFGRERWPELQRQLIEAHGNIFGLIMRVVRAGVVRDGDPVTVSTGATPSPTPAAAQTVARPPAS